MFIGLIINVFLENPRESLIQYVQMKVSDVISISGRISHNESSFDFMLITKKFRPKIVVSW